MPVSELSLPSHPTGVDSMFSYEQVLRQLRYRNWGTSATSDRKFRIKCSELNGRYTSNEFNLEVSNEFNLEVSNEFSLEVSNAIWE